ncbi:unnamed protein product [Ceratitis capitata]|uniref:(Mediterranean fruit fly) hypothetical protein n=1 Tax=Ceratitis capitata TaxID=7213 RepID=A0A811UZ93_CERCA|nr:unnamed protein product [Ceratitis capitata]
MEANSEANSSNATDPSTSNLNPQPNPGGNISAHEVSSDTQPSISVDSAARGNNNNTRNRRPKQQQPLAEQNDPPSPDAHSNKNQDSNLTEKGVVRYGKCKWFNVAKGWGFITPHDGGQEVFVHQGVIQMSGFRSLAEQEEVEFVCRQTERGMEATQVCGRKGHDCVGSSFRPFWKKKRRPRCYNCGKFNHIAASCPSPPQPSRCHICQSEEHLFAQCPMRRASKKNNDESEEKPMDDESKKDQEGDANS